MLSFRRFKNAAITLADIELMHRIRKNQFNLVKLGLKEATVPTVWNTVLSEGSGILLIESFSYKCPICTRIHNTCAV
jgi:hypothetical protein